MGITPEQNKPVRNWKYTVAVDFDGVIHTYDQGWKDGSIYGDVIPGAWESLVALQEDYEVVIFTARDTDQVFEWMKLKGCPLKELHVTNIKPRAIVYLDDRGLRFDGWESAMKVLSDSRFQESAGKEVAWQA